MKFSVRTNTTMNISQFGYLSNERLIIYCNNCVGIC